MGDPVIEELKQTVEEGLKALARAVGAKTYFYTVSGNNQVAQCASADLKPYERALVDEIEKASANHIIVYDKNNPLNLMKAEEGLARTKHSELHPIVAVLIEGLNKLNNHKVSRSAALKDSSSLPAWWPHTPKKYAERTQQLNIKELTLVIDAIFAQIRHDSARIEKLQTMLGPHFKIGSCSIGTRAVFDAYFDFLLEEARQSGNAFLVGGNDLDGVDFAADIESAGLARIMPRPSMTGGPNSGTAQMPSGFQAVLPSSNLHRPMPIHKELPEYTKQGLHVRPVGRGGAKESNFGPQITGPRNGNAVELLRAELEGATSGEAGDPAAHGNFVMEKFVDTGSRKRARVGSEAPWNPSSITPVMVPPIYVPPAHNANSLSTSPSALWPRPVDGSIPGVQERPDTTKAESQEISLERVMEEYAARVTVALQQLAEADCAKGCIWMLVGGKTGNRGRRVWCSPNVLWHSEALLEQVEKVIETPLLVSPANARLPDASDVLTDLVQSPPPSEELWPSDLVLSKPRADLAFVVGALVRGLNRITSPEASPTTSSVPDWFPYPAKYFKYSETLDKAELLHVLDVVFQKVRGEYFHIRELKAHWLTSRGDVSNPPLKAAVDVYLDKLEREARGALVPRS